MNDAQQLAVGPIVADGEEHLLTQETIAGLVALVNGHCGTAEALIFQRGSDGGYPATGYRLDPRSYDATLVDECEFILAGVDRHIVVAEPGDEVYYDNFGAVDGATYSVSPDQLEVTLAEVERKVEIIFRPLDPRARQLAGSAPNHRGRRPCAPGGVPS